MIKEFMDTVTIIDNTASEVDELIKKLKLKKILYEYYHPKKFSGVRFKLKNRKLIFLDLYIDNNVAQNAESQISVIRRYLKKIIGKDFGVYGIVLWTKHLPEIDIFKEKISQDNDEYTLPIFVVGLDKTKYLTHGFKDIFDDIETELMSNTAASFFIKWSNSIKKAENKTVTEIFSLINKYKFQDENLNYLLYSLAKNQTGIHHSEIGNYPLYQDAYKAFSELLFYEISSEISSSKCKLFSPISEIFYKTEDNGSEISKNYKDEYFLNGGVIPERDNLMDTDQRIAKKFIIDEISKKFHKINTKILLDENINHQNIIPGNIYEIKDKKSPFLLEACNIQNGDIPIIIEITPPCDFSNTKKVHPKVLGGMLTKFSKNKLSKYNREYYYCEIYPLSLNEYDDEMMIIFDFRHIGVLEEKSLKNKRKYHLKYRAKDKLFADVLQKTASHMSRLGLSVFHL